MLSAAKFQRGRKGWREKEGKKKRNKEGGPVRGRTRERETERKKEEDRAPTVVYSRGAANGHCEWWSKVMLSLTLLFCSLFASLFLYPTCSYS